MGFSIDLPLSPRAWQMIRKLKLPKRLLNGNHEPTILAVALLLSLIASTHFTDVLILTYAIILLWLMYFSFT